MEIIGSGGDSLPIGLVVSAPVGVYMDPAKWLRLSREAHAKADYPTLAEFLASQVNVPFQLQEVNQANSNDFQTMYSITRFNGFWIALARDSQAYFTSQSSPDRVTWTRDVRATSGTQALFSCQYLAKSANRVIAVPSIIGVVSAYSDDGRTWAKPAATIQANAGIGINATINNARYLRDRFWLVCNNGYVLHSQNGVDGWVGVQMPGGNANLRAIAWDAVNDRFLVGGDGGRCFSWDALNLAGAVERINASTESIFTLDHDGQAFYGLGSSGRKIRSVDGVNIVAGRFAPGISTPNKLRWIQDKGIWIIAASSRDLDGRSAFMTSVDLESNTIQHLLVDNNPARTTLINDFHYDPAAGLVVGRGAMLATSAIPNVNPATHFVTPAPSPQLSSGLVEYIKAA